MHPDVIPVSIRDRTGATIAFAVIDAADVGLAAGCWHLHGDTRAACKLYARRSDGAFLHHVIYGARPLRGFVIDHINGLALDNRRANLRLATVAENAQNVGRRTSNKSSRYRGVTWSKERRKWQAFGTLDGRYKLIGRFDSEDQAGVAAAAWRAEHMPFSVEGQTSRAAQELPLTIDRQER